MQLPVLSFAGMLEQMAAGVQGAASQLLDVSVGSVLRALLEASAAVGLWLQWMVLQVLSATRAATSQAGDLDTWMADFSFTRLGGQSASGVVTFSRYTIGTPATIAVGTNVLLLDGSMSFTVVADPNNSAWTGSAYSIPANLASINVPVTAAVVGTTGNVLAGAIGLIAAPIQGVDFVSNSAALAGGTNAESDAAFRARFTLYINSRSLATVEAIRCATVSIVPVVRCAVLENQDGNGNLLAGHFCVYADDGTGAPSAALLSEVASAVENVRPIGSTYGVSGPSVIEVNVTMSIETSNANTHAAVAAAVQAGIAAWVAALPIGGTLAVSKIEALAHDTDSSVVSVLSALINGAAADLTASANGVIILQTILVT